MMPRDAGHQHFVTNPVVGTGGSKAQESPMSSPSIELLKNRADRERIAEEWNAAVPHSFAATFSQPAWYFAWEDAFPPRESIIVTARESGRLVGILPLSRVRTDARGLYFPQITNFMGGDYQLPVVSSGANPHVLPMMLDAALEHFGRGFLYWWANLPASEPTASALASHLRSRGMQLFEQCQVAPRLDFLGRSYPEIEAGWAPSHRTDVRRQKKRLAAKGALSFWEPADLEAARALLEEFFVVHDEKWLSQGQPGRFQDPRQRAHFRAIVDRLWGRGLHFSTLRCGDVNVSFGFGFLSDGWVQWYRPTYRTDYQNLSPGKVHIALLVEEACRRGWKGVDFLQGAEGYKLQWSNQEMRTVDYFATFRPWSPAYQWFTRVKPYLRERVGPFFAQTKARLQKAGRRAQSRQEP
jgi:CelD/BcsL family acetyltransferase involved in cellulose biosynthesis